MTDGNVVLGGVVFQGFEVPREINFGGQQAHRVHDIIGGERVVDAMGPSASDISWAGRFRGADAIQRAQQIDQMRISGAQQQLTWLGVFYTVLVVAFNALTEKYYEVPYTIKCVVVNDPTQGVSGISASLDSLVGGDLSTAEGILTLAPTNVSTALSGLSATIAAAGTLQGASIPALAPVEAAAASAATLISSTIAATDPLLDAVSPDGANPAIEAAWLLNVAGNAVTQSALADAYGYVDRIALNIQLGAT